MADRLTRAQRSRAMSRVRSSGTAPERTLAAAFAFARVPVTKNARGLPGTPDLVVRGIRFAVFVHGCFWHGCPQHGRIPQTRRGYWSAKIHANRMRDRRIAAALRRAGWTVRVVWEHEAAERAATVATEAAILLSLERTRVVFRRSAEGARRREAGGRADTRTAGASISGPAGGADVCT